MADHQRRSQIWVNPPVQSYLLIHGLIFAAYFLVIFLVAEYMFFEKLRQGVEDSGLPENHSLVVYLFDYQMMKVTVVVALSLFLLAASIVHMLFVSHRICGPIFKLTKTLNELGDTPQSDVQIQFRHKDFFSEVAVAANRALAKVRGGNASKSNEQGS